MPTTTQPDAPTLTTNRLQLSRLTTAVAADLLSYRALPAVTQYQDWEPKTIQDAHNFINSLANVPFNKPGTWFQFGLRLAQTGQLIGDLGVHFPADQAAQAELGITVAPAYQRQGFAREALLAVMGYLFETEGVAKHRLYASVDPDNIASRSLLQAVGMRQEAHFRQSLWFKGAWVDDVIYAMLRSEWLTSSQPPPQTP